MQYTSQEYADIHLIYGQANLNARAAARMYAERFPNRRHPSYQVFIDVHQRLSATGSVLPARNETGRLRTTRTAELEEQILAYMEERPEASTREVGLLMGINHYTVSRILNDEGMHPYHYTKVQALYPEDFPKRLHFCRWLLHELDTDPDFISRILWTDECIFSRDGVINLHNLHQWGTVNPHATFVRAHQHRFSINVWSGILNDRLMGPVMLPNRVNGADFLQFLSIDLQDLLDDLPLNLLPNLWLQLDGAPPHFAAPVRQWLNDNFTGRWIGRLGPISWPPRSPDLNPLDFFLWGHLKNIVYHTPVESIQDLEARIMRAVNTVTPEMLNNVKRSMVRRARLCIQQGGQTFEHLL